MSAVRAVVEEQVRGAVLSAATAIPRSKLPAIAFSLTDGMRSMLRDLEACPGGALFMEFPEEVLLSGLTAYRLVEVLPAGLMGSRIALTARGRQVARTLSEDTDPYPKRSHWKVRIEELGAYEFFGTRAEAESFGLAKRWEFGGGLIALQPLERKVIRIQSQADHRNGPGLPGQGLEADVRRSGTDLRVDL